MRHGHRFFKDDEQEFLTSIALGSAAYRCAEAGEVLAATAAVHDGDRETWVTAWLALADRVRAIADGASGVSARDAYLRAAMYYGLAAFPALGTKQAERWPQIWRSGRDAWARAAELMGGEVVAIPYEGDVAMPGWLFRPAGDGPFPLVILNNGSDGANVDVWVQGGAAALERGYAALVFDGPGQNAMLHEHEIGFRPDWEHVITPIVDWALAQPGTDGERLALLGVSQAGYWVPRAVAFEHRIAAAVADPGVMDVASSWMSHVPASLRKQLDKGDREGFDRSMKWGMRFSKQARFQMAFRAHPYEIDDPFDVYKAVQEYRLDDETIAAIRCPMLVCDPENETFWPGESEALYAKLTGPKELVRFTAAEGADLHCEVKAPTLRNQRVFDWLDRTLGAA
jgi:hypothetical protein